MTRSHALVLAFVAVSSPATAAPLSSLVRRDGGDLVAERALGTELGLDGAMTLTVSFAAGLARAGERLALAWWTELTWVAGDLDVGDHRASAGVRIDLVRYGRVRLRGALAASRGVTETTGYSAQTFATKLELAPTVTYGRFTAAAELSVEQAWLAYITPSETYRDLVYEMAEAGWYGMPGRNVRAGGAVASRAASVEIVARAGYANFGSIDFLPRFYATLGAAYRF